MYKVFKFVEDVWKYIKIKLKIFYWKLKYGKRIKIGNKFSFRKGMLINISKNGYLEIGNNNFFNNYCSINCHNKIVIGNNNLFGENVKIYDHNHVFNDKNVDRKTTFRLGEIIIGNDNWIASNVVILSKAQLGERNVIAANEILNEKIENDSLLKTNKTEKIRYK